MDTYKTEAKRRYEEHKAAQAAKLAQIQHETQMQMNRNAELAVWTEMGFSTETIEQRQLLLDPESFSTRMAMADMIPLRYQLWHEYQVYDLRQWFFRLPLPAEIDQDPVLNLVAHQRWQAICPWEGMQTLGWTQESAQATRNRALESWQIVFPESFHHFAEQVQTPEQAHWIVQVFWLHPVSSEPLVQFFHVLPHQATHQNHLVEWNPPSSLTAAPMTAIAFRMVRLPRPITAEMKQCSVRLQVVEELGQSTSTTMTKERLAQALEWQPFLFLHQQILCETIEYQITGLWNEHCIPVSVLNAHHCDIMLDIVPMAPRPTESDSVADIIEIE